MSEYKKQFALGVFYISAAKYAGIAASILISAILARLLSPADFGTIAIATVFISFANLVTDFGFAPAIIQKDDITGEDYRNLFSITAVMGLIGCLALLLLAPVISSIYNENKILELSIYLLSINVIFAALNIVPNALLLKQKNFKFIAIRTISMQVFAGIVAVLFAFSGFGIYALIFQSLISSMGVFILNFVQNPIMPTISIRKESIEKVFNFSAYQFVSGLLNYFQKVIDRPIVGKFFSLADLGYYEKSWRLMMLPVQNLSYVFTPVMQPMFKDFSDNMIKMEQKFGKLLKFVSIIAFPLSAFLFYSSSDLILLFYGSQWKLAIPPLRYLSLSACFYILLSLSGPIYLASNHFKLTPIVSSIELVVNLISIFIGIMIGSINSIAYCLAIGAFFRFVIIYSIIYKKVFHLNVLFFVHHIRIGVLVGFLVFVTIWMMSLLFFDELSITRLLLFALITAICVISTIQKVGLVDVLSVFKSLKFIHKSRS